MKSEVKSIISCQRHIKENHGDIKTVADKTNWKKITKNEAKKDRFLTKIFKICSSCCMTNADSEVNKDFAKS